MRKNKINLDTVNYELGHCKLPEDQELVFVSQYNGKDQKLQPKLPFPAKQVIWKRKKTKKLEGN